MRAITINLHSFDELTDKAKEKALQGLYHVAEYPWHDENRQTLKAIEKAFKLERFDWEYSECGSNCFFTLPHDFKQGMNRKKLALIFKYMKKDNPIVSGYWLLEDFEDKFWKCFDEKGDVKYALQTSLNALLVYCHEDMSDYFSDESLAEHAMANEYESLADGSLA